MKLDSVLPALLCVCAFSVGMTLSTFVGGDVRREDDAPLRHKVLKVVMPAETPGAAKQVDPAQSRI